MKRASKFFTDFEKSRIDQAVTAAESATSAEIVPAVATVSGRYDRAEDIVGVWLACILLAGVWAVLKAQGAEDTHWGTTWGRFELPLLIGAVALGFVIGAALATYVAVIRRIFTPAREMRDEVRAAAAKVFHDRRVHHTTGATGLLIYLSLYERMAALVADQTVLDSVGQTALDELCDKLVAGVRRGDAGTALCEAITDAGERLKVVLPRAAADRNEISNALVILD